MQQVLFSKKFLKLLPDYDNKSGTGLKTAPLRLAVIEISVAFILRSFIGR